MALHKPKEDLKRAVKLITPRGSDKPKATITPKSDKLKATITPKSDKPKATITPRKKKR